ncbi:MAG: hypothetical protein IJB27_04655 [Clostridia bacterium]|nr:hypothetical protein [Clostridia bacterium]
MLKKVGALMIAAGMLCALWIPAVSAQTNETLRVRYGGDVNGDGTVTTSDVRSLFAAVSGERESLAVETADANADGVLNMMDAVQTLRVTIDPTAVKLILPTVSATETAPEGEEISYILADHYADGAERNPWCDDVWIAQSYEELAAINQAFHRPNAAEKYDLTARYDEAFFEDKAVIVWAMFHEGTLNGMGFNGIVKNGDELCLKRTLYSDRTQSMVYNQRFILEIDKADLEGITTVTKYTDEYIYSLS